VLVRRAAGDAELIAGSANFTRRNLDDLNLETDVRVVAPADAAIVVDPLAYFERRWHNRGGRGYSLPYGKYAEDGWIKYWAYRFAEAAGMSTF
ncbi:MAG: phospholipase, partial [Wenzhouxiangellaceae bacterium]|nr:phospholipase [Wenzhouxiangellaceae bacterium]